VVRANLRDREGTSPQLVHSATAAGEFSDGVSAEVRKAIAEWLRLHSDACVWTGLTSNWRKKKKADFSVSVALHAQVVPPEHSERRIEDIPKDLNELNRRTMLRIRNSIDTKHKKYSSLYALLDHVRNRPFVLAVTAFDGPYPGCPASAPSRRFCTAITWMRNGFSGRKELCRSNSLPQ
jgi:hypothetical protein